MKRFLLLSFISVFGLSCVLAQGEANIWYFGEKAGIDFNSREPISNIYSKLNARAGSSIISDSDGNLLFYTNGKTVFNKNHKIMDNGTGLKGASGEVVASVFIIPKPEVANIYYIFTIAPLDGINYYEVNMSLNGGNGSVSDATLLAKHIPARRLTVMKSPYANQFWLITHKPYSSEFLSYKISSAGVNLTPVISNVGTVPYVFEVEVSTEAYAPLGQIKVSPDGNRIAVARYISRNWFIDFDSSPPNSALAVFDFDSQTGIVSNAIELLDVLKDEHIYGVEFSPNGKLLYATQPVRFNNRTEPIAPDGEFDSLFQYNLALNSQEAIVNSKIEVAKLTSSHNLNAMQLAPDCKIYIVSGQLYDDHAGQDYLNVINSPNILGEKCDFIRKAVSLEGRNGRAGLPSFLSSYFLGFEADDVCLGDPVQFNVDLSTTNYDSLLWVFKDGNTSTDLNPNHNYTVAGEYLVELATTLQSEVTSRYKLVKVHDSPKVNQPKDVLRFNNSGFHTFNLSLLEETILNGQNSNIFNITYYSGLENYNANLPIVDATAYKNKVTFEPERIIVKVENINQKSCFDTTMFNIQVIDRFPNYFTPNNDGFHDFWNVKVTEDDLFTVSKIQIYNRYGKLLKTLNPLSNGWDGNFNGNPLPDSDYWFFVELTNKDDSSFRVERGHFSLVR